MLIDSYPLENAVLKGTIPGRMLAGLSSLRVTGLGILGDTLRRPVSVRRPLLAPADWRGVSFGTFRSSVQEQAIQALGATPVVAFGPYRTHDLATSQIQGFELDVQRDGAPVSRQACHREEPQARNDAIDDLLIVHPGIRPLLWIIRFVAPCYVNGVHGEDSCTVGVQVSCQPLCTRHRFARTAQHDAAKAHIHPMPREISPSDRRELGDVVALCLLKRCMIDQEIPWHVRHQGHQHPAMVVGPS